MILSIKVIVQKARYYALKTLKRANKGIIFKAKEDVATKKVIDKFDKDVYAEFQRQKRALIKFLKSKNILQKLSTWSRKTYPSLYEKSFIVCSCEEPTQDLEYSLNCNRCGKLRREIEIGKSISDDQKKFLDKYIQGWDANVKPEKMEKVFDHWYPIAGEIAGNKALKQLGIGLAFDLKNPAILESFKTRGEKITGLVTQKTQKDFRNVLYKSYMEVGMSPYEVEKRIEGMFEQTYKNRARTIARTETATAQSEVSYETYTRNKVEKKSWLSIMDAKTRESHMYAASQEPIKMGEYFDMGNGNLMLHPHDPLGPVEEVANCRCDLNPIVVIENVPKDEQAWTGGPDQLGVGATAKKLSKDLSTVKGKTIPKKTRDYWEEQYKINPVAKDIMDGSAYYTQGMFTDVRMISADLDRYGTSAGAFRRAKALRNGKLGPDGFINSGEVKMPFAKDYTGEGLKWKQAEEYAKSLGLAVESSPVIEEAVYRGVFMKRPKVGSLPKVGDKLSIPVTSFTRSEVTAQKFSIGNISGASKRDIRDGIGVVYKVEGKRHGFNVSPFSPWNQQEELLKGTYRVKRIEAGNMTTEIRGRIETKTAFFASDVKKPYTIILEEIDTKMVSRKVAKEILPTNVAVTKEIIKQADDLTAHLTAKKTEGYIARDVPTYKPIEGRIGSLERLESRYLSRGYDIYNENDMNRLLVDYTKNMKRRYGVKSQLWWKDALADSQTVFNEVDILKRMKALKLSYGSAQSKLNLSQLGVKKSGDLVSEVLYDGKYNVGRAKDKFASAYTNHTDDIVNSYITITKEGMDTGVVLIEPFTHEIGHNAHYRLFANPKNQKILTEWKKLFVSSKSDFDYVTGYAKISWKEDFAETYKVLLKPELRYLKTDIMKKKIKWMQENVFKKGVNLAYTVPL